jgi:hypothetical protein
MASPTISPCETGRFWRRSPRSRPPCCYPKVMYGWAAMAAALSQVRHGNSAVGGLGHQNTAPVMRPRSRPDLDGAQSFPARYRGAFEREQHQADAGRGGRSALSSEARSTLSRRFGSAAAGDLISIVERMAAAADDTTGTDLRC